jgi:MYXO-CTERM domain-containing protein
MDRRGVMRWLQGIVAAGVVLAGAGRAGAEPTFLGDLQTALPSTAANLSASYGDCTPCHIAGGGGPSSPNLMPFGELLNQDGILPSSQAAQFVQVVAELKQDDPKVYDDLLDGTDPNPDVSMSGVHTPEYGCDVSRRPRSTAPGWMAAFGVLALVARRRRAQLRNGNRGSADSA